jgi:hypothetical protein
METSQTTPAHRALLEKIAGRLSATGFNTHHLPADEEVPFDRLRAALPADAPDLPPWEIDLAFSPGLEKEIEGAWLLQCFAVLPIEPAPGTEAGLADELLAIDGIIPLGSFGYLKETRTVYWRHVLLVPRKAQDVTLTLVGEAVWLGAFLLEQCFERIALAAGRKGA